MEDFGDARDVATIEDLLLIEANREANGGGSGRAVGVAEFID